MQKPSNKTGARKSSQRSRTSHGNKTASSGNRSVIVAVEVLKALAYLNGPAALGQVAQASQMSASRTHRYLSGLVQTGLVEQNAATGHYRLGPTAVELGLLALGQTDAIKLGNELLPKLTEQTGLVSVLSTWGSYGPTIVKSERGNFDTSVHIREGRTLPLLSTATGRVFVGYLPKATLEPVVRAEIQAGRKKSEGSAQRPSMRLFEATRKEVREHGLGRMCGEENPGLAAIAAPVFDHQDDLIMVVTVISIIGTFDDSYEGRSASELKAAANQLSRRLGARRPEVRNTLSSSKRPVRTAAE